MNERIREFLIAENKSSAHMAEEIGVQPSSISHILSGRNKPSLDFVIKMIEKYHFISTDWLLFGKGTMYRDISMQTLFDENPGNNKEHETEITEKETGRPEMEIPAVSNEYTGKDSAVPKENKTSSVKRVVWFYNDNSFEEFFPNK